MAERVNHESPINYKPVFQKFVEANQAFVACLATSVPKDEVPNMSAAQLDANCQREKNEIKRILDSNQMTMTQVVKDRINVVHALNELPRSFKSTTVIQ